MKLIIKKIFYLSLFLLNGVMIFAQEYKFTEKCEVFLQRKLPSKTQYNYFLYRGGNSSHIYMTEDNKTYRINDRENNFRQTFNSVHHSDTLKIKNFSTSAIVAHNPERVIKKIDIKKIAENKYSIKTYPTLKTKKSNLEIIFALKKSDYALVQYHFLDMSIIIQDQIYEALSEELNDNNNFQIESIELDYRNGYQFYYEINKCVNVNWAIDIS